MNIPRSRPALQISLIYAAVAGLWIFFSDRLLTIFSLSPNQLMVLETYMGLAFVIITSLLLYLIMDRELQRRDQVETTLQENQRALSTLLGNLPGLVYRSRTDQDWTMEFVSEGCLELTGYEPIELLHNRKFAYRKLIHEDDRDAVWDTMQSALQKRERFRITYRITTAAGEEKWVWEQGCGVYSPEEEPVALESFVTDFTEPAMVQQRLEQQVSERTRELSTLLKVSRNLGTTLELGPLLNLILDQLKGVVDYTTSSIFTLNHKGELTPQAYRGQLSQERVLQTSVSIQAVKSYIELFSRQKPVLITDVRNNGALARTLWETVTEPGHLGSWMGIPLLIREQLIGFLGIGHKEPNHYSPNQAELAFAFANQAAMAIEHARLYSETKQHADELETLLAVQQAVTSRLNTESVLQTIADQARRLTSARLSLVYLLEGTHLRVTALSGQHSPDIFIGYRIPVAKSTAGLSIQSGQPVIVPDTEYDARVHVDAIQRLGVRSYMTVPLVFGSQPIGVIAVADKEAGQLDTGDERIVGMLASGASIALQNAHFYHNEQERRRVAEGLRDMLAILNSDRSINEILDYIVAKASHLLQAQASAIFRWQEDETVVIQANQGLSEKFVAWASRPMNVGDASDYLFKRQQPVIIPDLTSEAEENDPDINTRRQTILAEGFRAMLVMPLMFRDEIYGALGLYFVEPRDFSTDDINLATSFCDQAALAIENARLKIQAEEVAILDERHRLARDLHDAVSQTLFSASLIAEMLPRVWDRYPEEARHNLEELRELTRGALAEMRILLLELRPKALTEAKLGTLLRQLTEAMIGRARIPVSLMVEGDRSLPFDAQIALYRIAQEALNNVTKHAQASQVTVNLRCQPERVELCISDDGRGFDPSAIPPNHLGVSIMYERAKSVGAALKIESQPEHGTQVVVTWQD